MIRTILAVTLLGLLVLLLIRVISALASLFHLAAAVVLAAAFSAGDSR